MESSRSPFLTPDIPPNLFCTAYIIRNIRGQTGMESARFPFLTPDIPPNLFNSAYIVLNN